MNVSIFRGGSLDILERRSPLRIIGAVCQALNRGGPSWLEKSELPFICGGRETPEGKGGNESKINSGSFDGVRA